MNQESFPLTWQQVEKALKRRVDRRRRYIEIDWAICTYINGKWEVVSEKEKQG